MTLGSSDTAELTELNMHEFEYNIDPESNFFKNVNNNCDYYTDDQFNARIKVNQGLSIIHFNSRSLNANFQHIKEYLHNFKKPFNIVAISETWINSEKGAAFELNGYELKYKSRVDKKGGGVALFVDQNLSYKVIENMTITVSDIMECITVEIDMGKKRNVIVSCVYRAPSSNIDIFKDIMEGLFANTNQKLYFICGDLNIDLLNPNKHKQTDEFFDALFSMSLFPMITKPSRVTSHCATLIDNLFTKLGKQYH